MLAAAILSFGAAQAQGCGTGLPPVAVALPTQITPVTLRILQSSLIPVAATDGFVHLAYAAQVTNVRPEPASLVSIVPTDAPRGFAPTGTSGVLDMDGKDITGMALPFKPDPADNTPSEKRVHTRQLQGGSAGIVFFDIRYQSLEDVPRLLSHRLSVVYPGDDKPITEDTDPIEIDCRTPVVISAPLKGSRWWNANGCCEVISPHRGATLPVNGTFRPPEQFAIDFEQLNAQDGCCTGPVKNLASWPFLGAPILAVADGVVVEKADDMPDQVPGEVKGITVRNATGNSIIQDIGAGRYVLYAHMRPGSIDTGLVAGTRLKRGQKIGEVGNTGSSTAPHLHFQVMDRPSALNAVGLPFVFDRQVLEGRVTGTANQANDAYDAGQDLAITRDAPITRVNQMPADGQVFGYNLP